MKDIKGNEITKNSIINDLDGRTYSIIEKNKELYAKSLFDDSGCGEYVLSQERIIRNGFKIIYN